jgi:predicted DNA-binding transcriptional regulator AlpA
MMIQDSQNTPSWAAPEPPSGTTVKFIRKRELLQRIPVCYPTLWRYQQLNLFPRPVQIGPNAIAWEEWRIDAWCLERIKVAGMGRRPNHNKASETRKRKRVIIVDD